MDVGDRVQAGQAVAKDVLGERAQKMFQDYWKSKYSGGRVKRSDHVVRL